MGTLRDSMRSQKLQKLAVRRSSLEVKKALFGKQIWERREKRWKVGLSGYLPKRTRHVQTDTAHFFSRHSTEDFGEQSHGVRASNSIYYLKRSPPAFGAVIFFGFIPSQSHRPL